MSDDDRRVIKKHIEGPTTKLESEQNIAAGQYKAQLDSTKQLMDIKVSSPYVTYFEDAAFSISAENPSGPFDILPGHHNFISLLNPCTMIIRDKENNEQKIKISGGVMHVKADKVVVFLDV